ncbi:MAG TPA: hypothetical protein VFH06_03185 [Candidatus Saccharimonadales bacterium]|nr:hypothetical protein [Candidatus Saccharimonadales bacterium]
MGRNRRTHGRSQQGMIAQPATMSRASDVDETSEKMERIADLVRESSLFVSVPYGTRARKLADEMLELFLDFSRIPQDEAPTVEMRISRLFTQAIIELRLGKLVSKADIRDARMKVEAAFHEINSRV